MVTQQQICFHCGDACKTHDIVTEDKIFCCNGCKSVYLLLNHHQLEAYYCINEAPGNTIKKIENSKFQYLDNTEIVQQFITFSNSQQTSIQLYLPQMHCSSCLWLLENLYKLHEGITSSKVNFTEKQLSLTFIQQQISFRQVVELLASIGYEPHITLQADEALPNHKKTAYKLGITGFCFANIMLISFPEYLGMHAATEHTLTVFFRYINLFLALPVFFYGATEFFINAWHSIKQRYLNIDAPIALAVLVTFVRSIYEIISGTGAGYLDSMSGIVFFMLVGRALQNKTFATLKFNRDYKSYFPIAVTIIEATKHLSKKVEEIKKDDVLLLHHHEIIPVDAILSKGKAVIDYSFITGENEEIYLEIGDIIYAGGKISGSSIEVVAIKEFSQNSFTRLWNNKVFSKTYKNYDSYITDISKYFSIVVLLLASLGFIYYMAMQQPSHAWNVFTAVLIVACPCALLLTSSFTFGYVIELFSNNGLFLKNADTVENIAKIKHIVFDKTGTITEANISDISYEGIPLTAIQQNIVYSLLIQSIHPLSKAIVKSLTSAKPLHIEHYKELTGNGIEAWYNDIHIKLGSASFTGAATTLQQAANSEVYIAFDKQIIGKYKVANVVKHGFKEALLQLQRYPLSLLSGDNESAKEQMQSIFPSSTQLLFKQSPQQKLDYVQQLQNKRTKVMMIGDGLNDAGALKQSDVGISVVANSFSFSPACDAIMEADKLNMLPAFIKSAQRANQVILGTFVYSLLYNIIGLYFALTAQLSPVVAAILMPMSSISIIIITFVAVKMIESLYLKKMQ